MGIILGGVSAQGLILDGHSVSLYVGGSPPVKVWPTQEERETVQITLGAFSQGRNQLRAALADRGLDYTTVTEIPFDIELGGTGSTASMFNGCAALTRVPDLDTSSVTAMGSMFYNCAALTTVPAMNTSQVTNMYSMFNGCASLTTVPDMDTSSVTAMDSMFYNCAARTDGNVRLIGRLPNVVTTNMILGSGLTREPFYDADGNPI